MELRFTNCTNMAVKTGLLRDVCGKNTNIFGIYSPSQKQKNKKNYMISVVHLQKAIFFQDRCC